MELPSSTFYIEPIILVVDDDPTQLLIVKTILEKAAHRVMTAPSGLSALEIVLALDEPLLLLVTDVDMPDMTGRALAEELRRTQSDLRVLYLTAYAEKLFGKSSMLQPHEAFLEKPVTAAALSEAVRLLLRRVVDQPEQPQ